MDKRRQVKQAVAELRWKDTQNALESVRQGKVVSGEQVHEWLNSWGRDSELSPPEAVSKGSHRPF